MFFLVSGENTALSMITSEAFVIGAHVFLTKR